MYKMCHSQRLHIHFLVSQNILLTAWKLWTLNFSLIQLAHLTLPFFPFSSGSLSLSLFRQHHLFYISFVCCIPKKTKKFCFWSKEYNPFFSFSNGKIGEWATEFYCVYQAESKGREARKTVDIRQPKLFKKRK